MVLPFAALYVAGEVGLIGQLVAAVLLLHLAVATFRREEILTRWK